ncbi:MAG: IMP dehydrogenase [Bacilli bacterium]|nr:IMP dehydrogenase [Bacilli bacterium]
MAKIINEISRTFSEYLLIPNLSKKTNIIENVSLKTSLVRFKKGDVSKITLNIPIVSAIMQSVSNDRLAIALAKEGGISFIFCSQTIEQEAKMIENIKKYKAGFVISDSNLTKKSTLDDVLRLKAITKHSTIAITDDGTANGKLLGLVTSRDYRVDVLPGTTKVDEFMTPINKLVVAKGDISLNEANDMIWNYKINQLPVLDNDGRLKYLVFRKDFDQHKKNVNEILDKNKRYLVGAGINSYDYKDRVPALIKAGADILCIDSSDGFSEWQATTIKWIKQNYKDAFVGAGNVVSADGFRFLANAGADFIKVGIGGGSICITRETKGIGRGQATAVIEVCKERDKYFKETGIYIPICSDGGIVLDYHITLALAMGADFVMLGRYFARFDESPAHKVNINGTFYKEYWGEGSLRARNWHRYDNENEKFKFVEGIDSYVPYAGSLSDNIKLTTVKIKSTMCNCGVLNIKELQEKAVLTVVSSTSIIEGGAHDVIQKDTINLK